MRLERRWRRRRWLQNDNDDALAAADSLIRDSLPANRIHNACASLSVVWIESLLSSHTYRPIELHAVTHIPPYNRTACMHTLCILSAHMHACTDARSNYRSLQSPSQLDHMHMPMYVCTLNICMYVYSLLSHQESTCCVNDLELH
jgi:hypothetical protein